MCINTLTLLQYIPTQLPGVPLPQALKFNVSP